MWYKLSVLICTPIALLFLVDGPAEAKMTDTAVGRHFAEENCARCHAVGRSGRSPVDAAPPFRTLGQHYSMDDLDRKLANGDLGDHPVMPHWLIDPADVKDLVSYIGSIQTR